MRWRTIVVAFSLCALIPLSGSSRPSSAEEATSGARPEVLVPPARAPRCASSSSIGDYTLAIDPSFSRIDVEVLLAAGVDRVAMNPFGAEWLDDGWATFVRDLDARAADGRPLRVEPAGPAAWRIEGAGGASVTLRYVVDLSFTREPWPPGNEQAGRFTGEVVYLVARPVFIAPVTDGPMRVRLAVPAGWTVSTPWPVAGADTRTRTTANPMQGARRSRPGTRSMRKA